MNQLIRKLQTRKNKKAQTALEYALVVGAITLVIIASWNKIGDSVQNAMEGKMAKEINDNLLNGNGSVQK
jgi:Flp pilus assembly pilin Flp